MVNFFIFTFTLLTKYQKTQYIFLLPLSNYQPNTEKDTHKFSFCKRKIKPTSYCLPSAHLFESKHPLTHFSLASVKSKWPEWKIKQVYLMYKKVICIQMPGTRCHIFDIKVIGFVDCALLVKIQTFAFLLLIFFY